MKLGGSLSLKQLRARGFDDAKIADMGGVIQGSNVLFKDKIGGFDSTGAVLKLPPRPQPKTALDWLKENGPRIWARAHKWARTETDLSVDHVSVWLNKYVRSVLPAKCQCDCRSHWDAMMLRTQPPYYSTNAEMFQWLVDRHNEVNAKLKKSIITLEQAHRIHDTSP